MCTVSAVPSTVPLRTLKIGRSVSTNVSPIGERGWRHAKYDGHGAERPRIGPRAGQLAGNSSSRDRASPPEVGNLRHQAVGQADARFARLVRVGLSSGNHAREAVIRRDFHLDDHRAGISLDCTVSDLEDRARGDLSPVDRCGRLRCAESGGYGSKRCIFRPRTVLAVENGSHSPLVDRCQVEAVPNLI